MSRSSTPARTILPKRVRLITSHSSSPISSAEPSTIAPRKKPKRTSPGSRTLVGQALGAWMSFEMPPNAASIWSAMITDSAIVISAWRRSWPWFQRRKTCWMSTPMTPMITVARIERDEPAGEAVLGVGGAAQREAEPRVLREPALLHLQRQVAAEQIQRAVRHVDHAHEAEDQREAARHDEVEPGERDAVERHDHELPQVVGSLDDQEDRRRRRRPPWPRCASATSGRPPR